MKRKEKLPELLSPAGSAEALVAAVSAGADAVYVGGKSFGARAFAKNFDIDELVFAVRYTHLHGVKLYVTVNTLIYDKEMPQVSDYIAKLYEIGVDAIITADIGVIKEARRRVPNLPVHASTQMSVHNTLGADMAMRLGCERVVLARELSLKDIVSVTERCGIETEIFLHGALCVCHSGQCLMSSLVGGRSGNRGECAQPCRLPYNGKYPLSLSDLSLAEHIPELIESGVASLKIEGRMKSPEYVYTVTKIYRTLLDEGRVANKKEKAALREIFSRGGFTDGYFKGEKFSHMTGIRTEKDKEHSKMSEEKVFEKKRVKVSAEVTLRLFESAKMSITDGKRTVLVTGATPSEAITSPLSPEDVKKRLSKMGATLLSLDPCDIKLTIDEGINLPVSALNSLRRDAAEAFLSTSRTLSDTPPYSFVKSEDKKQKIKTALFLNPELYKEVLNKDSGACEVFDIVFLPFEGFFGGAEGVYMPPVFFDSEEEEVRRQLVSAKKLGAKYMLVENIGNILLAEEFGFIPIGDFRLNITNSESKRVYSELGVECTVLSPELTLPMLRDIGGGAITYGRMPLMLTERCFIKENFGCEKCGKASLSDRTGAKFPMMREFGHRNLILNSRPTYMGDRRAELQDAGILYEHFIFSSESPSEALGVLRAYMSGGSLDGEVRRIGKRK